MEVGSLFVGKEQVRLPDGIQHGWVKVQGVIRVLIVGQTGVIPLLPQEDVDPVVLQPQDSSGGGVRLWVPTLRGLGCLRLMDSKTYPGRG